MCQLCSGGEEEILRERNRLRAEADRMRTLARNYDQLASGEIKPHMEAAKLVEIKARALIHSLVVDWL